MTKNKSVLLAAAAVAMLALLGVQGCSDSDTNTDSGKAGAAGEAGEAGGVGEAGAAPTAGTGGTVGEAGAGGAAAGAGGEAGAAAPTQAELCDDFCAGEELTCVGDLQPYASAAACLTACNGYARGKVGDTTGNTLDCRIYHLGAAMGNAELHCPHTGAKPTAFCVDATK